MHRGEASRRQARRAALQWEKYWAQAVLIIPLFLWLLAGARGGVAALFAARVLGGRHRCRLLAEGDRWLRRGSCAACTQPPNGCSSAWVVMGQTPEPQSGPLLRPGAGG